MRSPSFATSTSMSRETVDVSEDQRCDASGIASHPGISALRISAGIVGRPVRLRGCTTSCQPLGAREVRGDQLMTS